MPFVEMRMDRAMLRPALMMVLLASALPSSAVSLDDAIRTALAGNPEAVAAQARHAGAMARLAEARGAALPTATASGSIGTGRLDPQGYFGLQAADVTPRAALLGIEQPLFAGGRINAGRAAAAAGVTGAEAGVARTRALLSARVAMAYADVITSQREEALRRAQLAQMNEVARQAERRYQAGEAPLSDLEQARARRAEAEAGMADAEGRAAGAAARFTALTGLAADDLEPLPAPPAVPETRDAAVAAALAANPDIVMATAGADAASAKVRGAKAEWLPNVAAFAEASAIRDQFFPDYVADQAVVGVRARWTLFDGGRQGRIAAAKAEARAADAMRDGARRTVEAETIAAHAGVIAARRMVDAARARNAAATEALRATRLEVQVGMKPQLAQLDAEREALDAAVAEARADGMLLASAWQLKALTAAP